MGLPEILATNSGIDKNEERGSTMLIQYGYIAVDIVLVGYRVIDL